jgi:hypothetical protein
MWRRILRRLRRPQSGVLPRPCRPGVEHLHADPHGPVLRRSSLAAIPEAPFKVGVLTADGTLPTRRDRLADPGTHPVHSRDGPGGRHRQGGPAPARPACWTPALQRQSAIGSTGRPRSGYLAERLLLERRMPGMGGPTEGASPATGTRPTPTPRARRHRPALRRLGPPRHPGHEHHVLQPLGGGLGHRALPQKWCPAAAQGHAPVALRVPDRPDTVPPGCGDEPPVSDNLCAASALILDFPMRGSHVALVLIYAGRRPLPHQPGAHRLGAAGAPRNWRTASSISSPAPCCLLSGVWFSMEGTSADRPVPVSQLSPSDPPGGRRPRGS